MEWNYENEVLRFYDWLETNPDVGTSCIALWHALMCTWRRAGYPVQITVAISTLEVKTGLKAAAVKRARNALQQYGRIIWERRGGNQSAIYKIMPFALVALKEPQNDPQSVPQTDPQNDPQTDHIIYNNNDNIKHSENVVVNNNALVALKEPQNDPQSVPQTDPQGKPPTFLDGLNRHSEALKTVQKHYEKHIANLLSSTAVMKIIEFLEVGVESALICRAIDRSIDSGARNWVYAERIVDNCICKEILTLEQYEKSEANRKASKTRMSEDGGVKPNGHSGGNTQTKEQPDDPYQNITSIKL